MRMPLKLRREILAEIEPTPALTKRARAAANTLIAQAQREADKRRIEIKPQLVGSLYKGTHLGEPIDIDVFLLFDRKTPREVLERDGLALGKAVLDHPQLKYAEHPYVHGKFQDFAFDVVPAYRIRTIQDRGSAVDRSPFHARYVRRHLKPRQASEVRLLKRFLRGVGCYGADTATGGVSGYLAELLILKYGDLSKAVQAIAAWKPPVRLALEGEALDLGGPLVVVDPVDPARNVAAAVHPDTLDRLIRACRAFQAKPRRTFFFPNPLKPLSASELRQRLRGKHVLGVRAPAPPGREETLLPQGQRLAAKIGRALEDDGFRVKARSAHRTPAGALLLLWQVEPAELPAVYAHRGPRVDDSTHAARFLEKWKKHPDAAGAPRRSGDRWTVRVRRRLRKPTELLDGKLPILLEGFDYSASQVRTAKLMTGELLANDRDQHEALSEFLTDLDPWER